jgi:HK97 family phage major capsid protein
VNINNDMAGAGANAKSLAFGNLNKYMIRDAMESRCSASRTAPS